MFTKLHRKLGATTRKPLEDPGRSCRALGLFLPNERVQDRPEFYYIAVLVEFFLVNDVARGLLACA